MAGQEKRLSPPTPGGQRRAQRQEGEGAGPGARGEAEAATGGSSNGALGKGGGGFASPGCDLPHQRHLSCVGAGGSWAPPLCGRLCSLGGCFPALVRCP